MKKKLLILFSILTLMLSLFPIMKTNAASGDYANDWGFYIYQSGSSYYNSIIVYNYQGWNFAQGNMFKYYEYIGGNYGLNTGPFSSFESALDAVNSFSQNFNYQNIACSSQYGPSFPNYTLLVVNIPMRDTSTVDEYYETFEDYENATNPQPSWYQEMWDTLKEELGNPAFWFGQWFIDLIDNVYGNEDDPTGPPKPPLSTHVTIGNPTITPAPTPIPYSTVVIPKTDIVTGETVYETNYYYNISGTPIITSSPPTNTPAQNGTGNGNNYSPIGGDPYSIPQLSWLTNVEIGDSNYDGIDSVGDGLSSIDEIGSDYTDGMSAVQDATGTLPTTWILLIGVAAAIPLVAGLISRFLS